MNPILAPRSLVALTLLLLGCATYRPGTTTEEQMAHDNLLRSFRVYLPRSCNADQPAPLVLMFHGGFGNARQFERSSKGFKELADRDGFILAYLQGTGAIPTWNAGACCGSAARNNVDDVGFTAMVISHLAKRLPVDEKRIYAAGMSNGAMMAHRLACELSNRITAVAAVAGTIAVDSCQPSRPVAVLHIHGSKDAHVPYDGGKGCGPSRLDATSVDHTVDGWAQRNGCQAHQVLKEEDKVHCQVHTLCREQADVQWCRLEGSGHHWPGSSTPRFLQLGCAEDGPDSSGFSAQHEIWAFFTQHSRS